MALLQLLETTLRTAMERIEPSPGAHWHWGSLQVGDRVPYDALADYRGLWKTIERYNGLVPQANRFDPHRVGALRDTFAHGRVFPTGTTGFPLRLVKFGEKDNDGRFPVETIADMTAEWFNDQAAFVHSLIQKIESVPPPPQDTVLGTVAERTGHNSGHSGPPGA